MRRPSAGNRTGREHRCHQRHLGLRNQNARELSCWGLTGAPISGINMYGIVAVPLEPTQRTEGRQIIAADSFDLSSNAYRMLRASQLLNVADLLELVSSKGLIVKRRPAMQSMKCSAREFVRNYLRSRPRALTMIEIYPEGDNREDNMSHSKVSACRASNVLLASVFTFLWATAICRGQADAKKTGDAASTSVAPADQPASEKPVQLTAAQDHQRIMELLHMDMIRPGRNGSNPQCAQLRKLR